jgi:hypothetical protein
MHKKGISEVSPHNGTCKMAGARGMGMLHCYDISRIARWHGDMAISAAHRFPRHSYIGSRQEAHPPHSQAPACHCRCLARRDQGAPFTAPRGPRCRPLRCRQGRKGEEGRCRVKEEGREGQERVHGCTRPGTEDPEQAGRQGFRPQGAGKDSLSGLLCVCVHGSGLAGSFSG